MFTACSSIVENEAWTAGPVSSLLVESRNLSRIMTSPAGRAIENTHEGYIYFSCRFRMGRNGPESISVGKETASVTSGGIHGHECIYEELNRHRTDSEVPRCCDMLEVSGRHLLLWLNPGRTYRFAVG